jgi:hypothetical protein
MARFDGSIASYALALGIWFGARAPKGPFTLC